MTPPRLSPLVHLAHGRGALNRALNEIPKDSIDSSLLQDVLEFCDEMRVLIDAIDRTACSSASR